MKKKFSVNTLFAVFAFALSGLIVSSCNKSKNDLPQTPVAGFMAFNLAPDQVAVSVALSGSFLTTVPLGYSSYTGSYLAVYTGQRQMQSYNANNSNALATTDVILDTNKYYSAFVVGAQNNYRNVVVEDDFESMSGQSGKAYIRYIQAVPDSTPSNVLITAGGTEIVNDNARYADVSGFVEVDPGDITVDVNNGDNVDTDRTFAVEARKVYTILISGLPGSGNPDQAVGIKYIVNGSISADSGRPAESGRAGNIQ